MPEGEVYSLVFLIFSILLYILLYRSLSPFYYLLLISLNCLWGAWWILRVLVCDLVDDLKLMLPDLWLDLDLDLASICPQT